MSLAGQAGAATAANVIAIKLRALIEKAQQSNNAEAVALLRFALDEAESIKASADAGWW
jgi:hypothetical protein